MTLQFIIVMIASAINERLQRKLDYVKTRAVEIAGIATHPDGKWMQQMARYLTDSVDGLLRNATYLIHDRDPLFTEAFEAILAERGVKCVRIPARSPNCNPHADSASDISGTSSRNSWLTTIGSTFIRGLVGS